MLIQVEISAKRIRDLIEGAGSRYWANDFHWWPAGGPTLGFRLIEDECGTEHRVTTEMIVEGLRKMAASKRNEGGHHFADCMEDGSDDMYTGDALIQYAIFGELKYG